MHACKGKQFSTVQRLDNFNRQNITNCIQYFNIKNEWEAASANVGQQRGLVYFKQ
jgi:hypothetical protein